MLTVLIVTLCALAGYGIAVVVIRAAKEFFDLVSRNWD